MPDLQAIGVISLYTNITPEGAKLVVDISTDVKRLP